MKRTITKMHVDSSRPLKRTKPNPPPPPPPSRPHHPSLARSASASSSGSASSDEDDEAANLSMLAALQAHGQAFLTGSVSSAITKGKGKGKAVQPMRSQKGNAGNGFGEPSDGSEDNQASESRSGSTEGASEDSGSDSELEDGEGYDEDDGELAWGGGEGNVEFGEEEEQPVIPTVVFAPSSSRGTQAMSKADRKMFMSSKSSKLLAAEGRPVVDGTSAGGSRSAVVEEDDEERSNLALDKTLHSMLLTKLLPGAQESSRPVDKRNAVAGRLLELASIAPLGAGRQHVISQSYSTHPRHLKKAILAAKADRAEKVRKEAQEAGSWVKGVGGLGDGGKARSAVDLKKNKDRERERGLGMGIGKFKGGMLTLSKGEVERGQAMSGSSGRGRGGKRGGRGGRKGGSDRR